MEFNEGDDVLVYVDYVKSWVQGKFMFYYNDNSAYVRLNKLSIPIIEGKWYTNEPTIPVDKIKLI